MKKVIKKFAFATVAILTLGFSSCDALLEEDIKDYGDTPVLVQFSRTAATANVLQTDENPVYTYDIPVTLIGGRNQPIDRPVDVTVSVDPSSTATEGVEFELVDNSVTIPAGSMTANVQIRILSENLDPFDPKAVVLNIESADVNISETSDTRVVLQAACEISMEEFYGTYNVVEGASTYTSTVSEGPEPNTLTVTGLYGRPAGTTVIELNEDPTTPYVTFRSSEFDAALYQHSVYGSVWATTSTATAATYGSCNKSLRLVYRRCVSIGCFAGTTTAVLTKQ